MLASFKKIYAKFIAQKEANLPVLLLLTITFDTLLKLQLFYLLDFNLSNALLLTIGLTAVQFTLAWFHENTEISISSQAFGSMHGDNPNLFLNSKKLPITHHFYILMRGENRN